MLCTCESDRYGRACIHCGMILNRVIAKNGPLQSQQSLLASLSHDVPGSHRHQSDDNGNVIRYTDRAYRTQ
jgi:hypothetical protein